MGLMKELWNCCCKKKVEDPEEKFMEYITIINMYVENVCSCEEEIDEILKPLAKSTPKKYLSAYLQFQNYKQELRKRWNFIFSGEKLPRTYGNLGKVVPFAFPRKDIFYDYFGLEERLLKMIREWAFYANYATRQMHIVQEIILDKYPDYDFYVKLFMLF